MNTKDSIIDERRIEQAIQMRFSPFPQLTMELLSSQLNGFRTGDLRLARIWEIMMERDGDLAVPADKLYSDIARLPWEIEKAEDSAEADAHHAALEYFYRHLTAGSVLEADETGGINLLLRQMMTAHAYRYSVHEMILQVNSAARKEVTAHFNHCPVWFFESRKGRLAYLPTEFAQAGQPLEPGAWLAAVGRGMMRQCSIAYLTKWQPMAYWGLYCYRFGLPGIHGETDAAKGSQEWNDFVTALGTFANDWVTATNRNAKINLIEASKGGAGTLPFQELIERSDRLYARAFRGGDLSTQSRAGDVSGSNPQDAESRIIMEDGGQWATDILNCRVDEPLIAYLFNTTPKAWIRIRPPAQMDSTREINTLKAARELGVPLSIDTARERLELPAPEDGEELVAPPAPAPVFGAPPSGATRNQRPSYYDPNQEKEDEAALENSDPARVAQATAEVLAPILAAYDERLQRILTITDPALRAQRWAEIQAELATLEADHLAEPTQLVRALEQINAKAFVAGLTDNPALANGSPDQSRDSLGRWVDENGGGLSEGDNIARGGNAVDRALRQKVDVQKAMYRKEVGQIDFEYGRPGTAKPDAKGATHKDGYGISHIVAKHGESTARQLPEVLGKGKITPHEQSNRRYVRHAGYQAVIEQRTARKAYVITNFDRENP